MDERSRRIARGFEVPVLVAALLVIPVIAIEQSSVGEPWDTVAGVTNWAIWIAFTLELVVMLAIVPDRWGWLRTHPLEVVVVLLTPPFAPANLQAVRALRLLRLLRLIRVAGVARRVFSLDGLRYAALVAALTALGGGYLYSIAERSQDPPPSVWDGTWWAFTTMTTVGYGDEYPLTTLGRLYAVALMIVGIGFVAVLTGAVAERFLASEMEDVAEAAEQAAAEAEINEDELLAELREIRTRLDRIESRARPAPRNTGRGVVIAPPDSEKSWEYADRVPSGDS